jgi:hypothetical protein
MREYVVSLERTAHREVVVVAANENEARQKALEVAAGFLVGDWDSTPEIVAVHIDPLA